MSKKKLKKRVKELEKRIEHHEKQTIKNLENIVEWLNDLQQTPENIEVKDAEHVKSEELTELPDKWCINVTDSNINTINIHTRHVGGGEPILGCYLCGNAKKKNILSHSNIKQDEYTEITTEQFKKWVLKEEIDWDKPQFIINNTNDNIVFSTGKRIYKR